MGPLHTQTVDQLVVDDEGDPGPGQAEPEDQRQERLLWTASPLQFPEHVVEAAAFARAVAR